MSDRVDITILGCGGMAGAHARRLLARQDVRIVGICDVSPAITDAFLARHFEGVTHKPQAFTDAGEMYRQTRPAGVVIVTPHTMHYQHAVQALEAGCHVLMEKPMVTSADDAHKLKAKVRQAGRIFVIGYNTPSTPELNFIRQQIRDNTLGPLQLISGYLVQNWQKVTANTWRQNPALSGGGQAYDSGAHMLNSVCWTVESGVVEVFAFIDNNGSPVDINSVINIRFANGAMASLTVGGNTLGDAAGMVYVFEKGRIEFNPWSASYMRIYQGNEQVKYPVVPGKPTLATENFIDAIRGLAQPATSVENGIIQSELMDAIYESARTGKPARPATR